MTKEEVIDIAKGVGKDAVERVATRSRKGFDRNLDMNLFLQSLEAEMNSYAFEIRHIIVKEHVKQNYSHLHDVHKYILKHDAGENYSLYYKTVLDFIFPSRRSKTQIIESTLKTEEMY